MCLHRTLLLFIILFTTYMCPSSAQDDNVDVGLYSVQAIRHMKAHNYEQALVALHKGEQQYGTQHDTISNLYMTNFLRPQFDCYIQMGQPNRAVSIASRIFVICDSITRRSESVPQKVEKMVPYVKRPAQNKVADYENVPTSRALTITCILLGLLSVLLTVLLIHYILSDRRKNKAQMALIARMRRYKHLFYGYQYKGQQRYLGKESGFSAWMTRKDVSEEEKQFGKMMLTIIEKKLYLNPNLTRQDIIDEVHIPKNKFAQMFQKYVNSTFKNYINSLRIDEAMVLMKRYPDYTIETIAAECGMPSVQTFYRAFADNVGLSPTEYKIQLQNNEEDEEKSNTDNEAED